MKLLNAQIITVIVYLHLLVVSSVRSHGNKRQRSSRIKLNASTFVPSIAPSITTSCPAPIQVQNHRRVAIASGYFSNKKIYPRESVHVFSSSNKELPKSGKIQIKLLKDVPGIGHVGDYVLVATAFFQNKLRPSRSGIKVTAEEMAREIAEKKQHEKEKREHANDMKEKIEQTEITVRMKAGPDGHLFGGIGYKNILEELKKKFPSGALDGKNIKISRIADSENKDIGHDIKQIGNYKVTVSLMKDLDADCRVNVLQS